MSAAILGSTMAASVMLAAPALAAHNSLCPSNKTCGYEDSGYVGLLGYFAPGTPLRNFSSGSDNKLSSWENLTATNARFYYNMTTDPNGLGKCIPMNAHSSATVYPGDGNPDNDKASSWGFDHGCP